MAINLRLKDPLQEETKKNIYGLDLHTMSHSFEVIQALKDNVFVVKDALEKNGGWLSKAAKALSCTVLQLSAAISQTPELLEKFLEIREYYLDLAENKLISLVKTGDLEAVKFWLKCQGKSRGWTERMPEEQDKKQNNFIINIEPAFGSTGNVSPVNEEHRDVVDVSNAKATYAKEEEPAPVSFERKKLEKAIEIRNFNDERVWQTS